MNENGSTSAGRSAPITRLVHSLRAATRNSESKMSGVSGGRSLMRDDRISPDLRGRGNMTSMVADPLDASAGVPHNALAALRDRGPVSRTPSGTYFLARHPEFLAAPKNIPLFPARFRSPGERAP